MVDLSATSSSLESTGSVLFSVPSDFSDVQTEITPPTSPALSQGKMRTPRDILDASRRLGQIALQVDVTPTKPPEQLCQYTPSESVANDEAGYDADGDGDGDGDEGPRARADAAAKMRPIRRPGFPRIDTRQHRRVASMLAIRRPSPGFGNVDAHMDISYPPRARLAPLYSIPLKSITITTSATVAGGGGNAESYELRRKPRLKAEPVGLGIGFPENHPLRSRAFTMPVSTSVSPVDDFGPSMEPEGGIEKEKEQRPEWFPSPAWLKKSVQIAVCAPSPVRLAKLRPTFLEVSPSPIECLPGAADVGAGAFRCDVGVDDRSEVSVELRVDHGNRRTMRVSGCDAETERKRDDDLAREGQMDLDLDLSKSTVMFPTSSEVTMTFDADVGPHSALSRRAL